MSTTNLQIPLSKNLKADALAAAKDSGFSSLQEFIRVMLTKLAKQELHINVSDQIPPVQLSARSIKRYEKIDRDFKEGKNIHSANSIEDFLKQLNS